jgi:hypothetical protein
MRAHIAHCRMSKTWGSPSCLVEPIPGYETDDPDELRPADSECNCPDHPREGALWQA